MSYQNTRIPWTKFGQLPQVAGLSTPFTCLKSSHAQAAEERAETLGRLVAGWAGVPRVAR